MVAVWDKNDIQKQKIPFVPHYPFLFITNSTELLCCQLNKKNWNKCFKEKSHTKPSGKSYFGQCVSISLKKPIQGSKLKVTPRNSRA